jgi:RNA polymerase sigma-70 factor (ECF subfamily)
MNASPRSDKELIISYLNGDSCSFDQLFSKHHLRVYNFILSKVKCQAIADDILQDTFMKVIKTLHDGNYKEEGKFLPWVMRIAYNLIIDHFRLSKKMQYVRAKGEDEEGMDVLELLEELDHENLKNIIALLPEEQREVLEMRHFHGMSFQDIAEETEVSINTALGRMRYALMNIRKLIQGKENILLVS